MIRGICSMSRVMMIVDFFILVDLIFQTLFEE